jgi:hypothetical protein
VFISLNQSVAGSDIPASLLLNKLNRENKYHARCKVSNGHQQWYNAAISDIL